jgi:NAD(P)-dependent dehydrogenase (short-subunit alcohol dehydrogenase family)
MTSKVKEKYDNLIGKGIFPIARWGNADDVASAVSVFAGENFLYTTGNHVDVDGGFHIRRL